MLRAKQINRSLEILTTDGIVCALLCDRNGILLGSAGLIPSKRVKLISAIASNFFSEFKVGGDRAINGDGLKSTFIDLEEGKIGITSVGSDHLVCMCAESKVKAGFLKAKLEAAKRYFDEQIRTVLT